MHRGQQQRGARKRSVADALAGVDELLRARPLYEGTEAVWGDGARESTSGNASLHSPTSDEVPAKRMKADPESSPASPQLSSPSFAFESLNSSDGLGGTEMELLGRRDDAAADLALFFARALSQRPAAVGNLCELLEVFARTGVPEVLSALKHNGTLDVFFDLLFPLPFEMTAREGECGDVALMQFLSVLAIDTDVAAFCRPRIVSAVVRNLREKGAGRVGAPVNQHENDASTPVSGTANPRAAPQRGHWSDVARRKRSTKCASPHEALTGERSSEEEKRLRSALAALRASSTVANDTLADNIFGVSLRFLLDLVLRQNQQGGELAEGTCVANIFAKCGGLQTLVEKLRPHADAGAEHTKTTLAILSFLEVLTASGRLDHEDSLGSTAHVLLTMLAEMASSGYLCASRERLALVALRVLTNITGSSPDLLAPRDRQTLGSYLHRRILALSSARPAAPPAVVTDTDVRDDHCCSRRAEDDEEEIFALCCAVNVLKWERRSRDPACTSHLLPTTSMTTECHSEREDIDVLAAAAAAMLSGYKQGRTEDLVRSGYYALFLGVASLAVNPSREDASYRVPVMTAVATAAGRSSFLAASMDKPMAVVVAIVQEFLLFQSASGTLTRSALVEMNQIVSSLIEANQLPVSSL